MKATVQLTASACVLICLCCTVQAFDLTSEALDSNLQPSHTAGNESDASDGPSGLREGKFLSLFTIVRFSNSMCSSNSTFNGTCLTAAECNTAGGSYSGTCASGFGVCCILFTRTCGSTITKNCTYWQNPNYPSANTNAMQCVTTVQKCSTSICQIRIDFLSMTLVGPDATAATTATNCLIDQFTVYTGLSSTTSVPVLCGSNSYSYPQHMYVNMSPGQNNFVLGITLGTASTTNRYWNIKISQIDCSATYQAPPGCTQYYTEASGIIQSYNFLATPASTVVGGPVYQLANQNVPICIRAAQGFCSICYSACTYTGNNFGLSDITPAATPATSESTSLTCQNDYLMIPGGYSQLTTAKVADRFCGGIFNAVGGQTATSPVCTSSQPFELRYITNGNENGPEVAGTSHGFCLTYAQQPCTASG